MTLFRRQRMLSEKRYIPFEVAGAPGAGVPQGGTAGQVIMKNSSLDYDTSWSAVQRAARRIVSILSSPTPAINTDACDQFIITAQAVDITSFTTNLSGTPINGQALWVTITGTGARNITWGTSFESSTVVFPPTTVSTDRIDVGFIWNNVTNKWRCVAVA